MWEWDLSLERYSNLHRVEPESHYLWRRCKHLYLVKYFDWKDTKDDRSGKEASREGSRKDCLSIPLDLTMFTNILISKDNWNLTQFGNY